MTVPDNNREERWKDDQDINCLLDSLISIIKKEAEIYGELWAILTEENRVLRRPTLELLSESNAKKETCILKARMLEEVQANIVKKIAGLLGKDESEINLTFLSSCADESRTKELKTQQKILFPLTRSINEANEKNKHLLEYSLSFVRNSMNFISDILSTGAGYAHNGKLKTNNRNGGILYREG